MFRYVSLSDTAFPLQPYRINQYGNGGKAVDEEFVCSRLSSARMVVGVPSGRLQTRFVAHRREMD